MALSDTDSELFAPWDDIPAHLAVLMFFPVFQRPLRYKSFGMPPAKAFGPPLFADIALILCQSLPFSCKQEEYLSL